MRSYTHLVASDACRISRSSMAGFLVQFGPADEAGELNTTPHQPRLALFVNRVQLEQLSAMASAMLREDDLALAEHAAELASESARADVSVALTRMARLWASVRSDMAEGE